MNSAINNSQPSSNRPVRAATPLRRHRHARAATPLRCHRHARAALYYAAIVTLERQAVTRQAELSLPLVDVKPAPAAIFQSMTLISSHGCLVAGRSLQFDPPHPFPPWLIYIVTIGTVCRFHFDPIASLTLIDSLIKYFVSNDPNLPICQMKNRTSWMLTKVSSVEFGVIPYL